MKCEGCGNNLNIEQKFCPYCGKKIQEADHAADENKEKNSM